MMWRRVAAVLAVGSMLLGAQSAAADDSGLNQEGFWTVGRGDAESKGCWASVPTQSGGMFVLYAQEGYMQIAVSKRDGKRLRQGKKGVLTTEAYSFEFEPTYDEEGELLFVEGPLNERVMAALRLASDVQVLVDGREVLGVHVEGTGFEGAIDAVAACSLGESGWWGPGVDQPKAEPATTKPEHARHKAGIWSVVASENVCTAAAEGVDGRLLIVVAANGGADIGVAVGGDSAFKRGRKGLFETDAYSFSFKPDYGGDDYFHVGEFLDSQALFALRRAKSLYISVDGQEMINAELQGTGFADVLDSLIDCAAGKSGWWGEGAKRQG